jgi:hypothetical protein
LSVEKEPAGAGIKSVDAKNAKLKRKGAKKFWIKELRTTNHDQAVLLSTQSSSFILHP